MAAFLVGVLGLSGVVTSVQANEYRAFWVDAWGTGILNQSQVEALLGKVGSPTDIGQIRAANCNAVVVQVRRRADVCYPSAVGEPYFSGLSPANFNALQAVIDAAHDTTGGKQRIEVHAWIVTFATSSGGTTSPVYYNHIDPPTGSLTQLDNYWPTRNDTGSETEDKAFDPGHPKVLEYLVNVCMDLVNNFDIDGLHFDYIRFTGSNQGYNPTSVARFNARHGLTGQPSASSELFKQWRRDQISALVRQVYARIQATKPQVKLSGAFVTWNPSPTASTRSAFMNTRPYYEVYSDWDSWIQEGIIDVAFPMTYYNWASLPNDYVRWMNFQKDRKGNRHMVIGPGIYLNSLSNAIHEILLTRDPSPAGNYAHGFCGYSYRVPYSGGTWSGFSPSLVAQVTPTWRDIPAMPWKTSPTTGHMMGTVRVAPSQAWADGATVSVTGPVNRTQIADGTGFYAFIDLPPGQYTVTAGLSGYPQASASVTVTVGQMSQRDLLLGGSVSPPIVSAVQVTGITASRATVSWTTDVAADSQVEYGTTPAYGLSTPLSSTPTTSHAVTLTGLSPGTRYYFRARSANAAGAGYSPGDSFVTLASVPDIIIDNLDPGWSNTSPGGNTWTVGSISSVPKIGTNYLYQAGTGNPADSSATHRCRWTPDIPTTGLYDVYVFYQMGTNRNTAAPYRVVHHGGTVTSIQNQYSTTSNQGDWKLIGANLPFLAGTAGYVELSNNSADTKLVSADAARFVYKGPAELTPPTTPVVSDGGRYTPSLTELSASWISEDPETGISASAYRILEQPGGTVVRDWTSVGPARAVTATGLNLQIGRTYFFEVRTTNGAGMVSAVGTSDGITVFRFDIDDNGVLDQADFEAFRQCLSGAMVPYAPLPGLDCGRFDPDLDGDVDASDFGAFQRCLSGLSPIDLSCQP